MYRRILVALADEERDQALLAHVQQLAMQVGAELTLLRVIAVAEGGGGGLGKQFQLEIGSSGWRRKNEAETYLSGLVDKLGRAGLPTRKALVVSTRSEGDEIVSYAASGRFDLIAMAADSRPWYKRLLCSAQDDDVLRKANVPTLFLGDSSRGAPLTRTAPKANPVMAILGSAEL
jgi:nucleotide-binding universal stress UspA family protein